MAKATLLERLLGKVKQDDATGCWLWTAYTHPTGYGRIAIGGGHTRNAHQVAYQLLVGPVADGLELDHLCRVRRCINPAHLEPVTHQINVIRGAIGMKTHCPYGHAYTTANTYRSPSRGARECRTCQRRREQARRTPRIPKTHCQRGHAFEGDNVFINPKGNRECKACRAAAMRRYTSRRAAKAR